MDLFAKITFNLPSLNLFHFSPYDDIDGKSTDGKKSPSFRVSFLSSTVEKELLAYKLSIFDVVL